MPKMSPLTMLSLPGKGISVNVDIFHGTNKFWTWVVGRGRGVGVKILLKPICA